MGVWYAFLAKFQGGANMILQNHNPHSLVLNKERSDIKM